MSDDKFPDLFVRAGLHCGAQLTLANRTYVIGCDSACDIVLFDPGVMPRHVSLVCKGGSVAVTPLHGAVLCVDGHESVGAPPLLMGEGMRLHVGEAVIEVSGTGTGTGAGDAEAAGVVHVMPRSRLRDPVRWKLAGTAMLGICVAGAALSAIDGAAPDGPRRSATAHIQSEGRIDFREARVREFIDDDGLRVEKTGDGRIRVSGRTSHVTVKRQLEQLTKEFSGGVEIVDAVDYVPLNAPPKSVRMPVAITAVHLQAPRWFGTRDGQQYFEGAAWDGGIVEHITPDGIVFKRGNAIVVYPFENPGA